MVTFVQNKGLFLLVQICSVGLSGYGKRSPEGQLLEYAYTREPARRIVTTLKSRGYDSELLVPEDDDIPLSERVRRTNAHCQGRDVLEKNH